MARTPEKIGMFGGSFDPPHLGHFICARIAAEELGLSRVLVIPAAVPPHKQSQRSAPADVRWEMVCAAVEDDPLFQPSRIELDRGGVSYSVETLEALGREYPSPDYRLFLLIGDDSYADLTTWREPERIMKLVQVAIMNRWDADDASIPTPWQEQVIRVNTPRIEISSTAIRERLKTGLPVDYWVGERVAKIIARHKLYR
jgi:nicotinate-nucleotide adenylyltransferase